jgi:hypothetical protein
MAGRQHHARRQLRLDLMHQGTQVSLDARVLLQQVSQPGRPLRLQRRPGLLQLRPGHRRELTAGLLQPPAGQLSLLRATTAEQPPHPVANGLPDISRGSSHHRIAG